MQFQDDLAAGVTLVRPALQSPDYAAGALGWAVMIDGSAEFNDVVVRGTMTAVNGSGDYAMLTPDAPSWVPEETAPGLLLSKAAGDVTPAGLTEFDDTFTRGLYLRTSSAVDILSSLEGVDYASIRMEGRFHGSDPQIALKAGDPVDAPAGGIWINGTHFDASGGIDVYASSNQSTYIPTVTGGGSATYSKSAWYYRLGPLIYVNIMIVVNAAGSGANPVNITMPTAVERTNRQILAFHADSIGSSGAGATAARAGAAVFFVGGSGDVTDRLRVDDSDGDGAGNVLGVDLKAGAVLTVQGWYLEQP